MREPLLKISEMATFFSVSVKALRHYEKMGILRPARVDPVNGYRYYRAEQIYQLNALLELQSLGFSLKEIGDVLKGKLTAGNFSAAIEKKIAAWERAAVMAQGKAAAADRMRRRVDRRPKSECALGMSHEQRAFLLAKLGCVETTGGVSALVDALWV